MKKRILSMVLAVMLIVTILPTTALAVENNPFSDIADHWAESVILKDQAKGFVQGMPDGTFEPDDLLTNAQLITLVNRFFGLTMSEDNQFADVEGDEWYAGEADKAEYYGYVDSAALNGDIPILRLDMLWILDSMMHVEETAAEAPFDDLEGLSGEELDLVNRFYARGYLEGDGQGNATLGDVLTRAQVLTFFDNTLGYIVLTQEDVANIPENGKVTVIGQNIVIEAKTIEELYISPGVYGNVTVKNTVLKNATLGGEGTDGAVIFDNVTVSGELIVQDGIVDLTGTTIKKVTISGESKINTDKDTAITSLEVNAPVTITGGGKITEAEITVDGAAIEKKPTYYVVKNGVTADVGGDKTTYTNDRPRPSVNVGGGGTTTPTTPAQGTQVKLVSGAWVIDASGSATGIWKIEDLALVGSATSGVWELSDSYVLMADLDFDADDSYRDAAAHKSTYTAGSGFTPIGDDPNFFTGSFDGNGNTIANLYINRSANNYIGLFGYADSATIKNIGLTGANITGTEFVGGLIGRANGSTVTNSYATGSVTGVGSVGGLVGGADNYSTITNSYATGTASGAIHIGGLVGIDIRSSITDCYATGYVEGNSHVGGLVGYLYGHIKNAYATGSVTATGSVGGLVGYAYDGNIINSIAFNLDISGSGDVNRILGAIAVSRYVTLTGNYANEAMSVTGIAVGASDKNGADMTAEQFKTSSSAPYSGNWDFTNTWEIKTGAGRPTLREVVVTSIAVKTAPTKVTYDEGDSLDLAGLVITLTNNDSSTEDVGTADFSSKGITSDPVAGATLGLADTVITISFGGLSTTQDITTLPAQGAQVSYSAGGTWVVDASGSATGIWKIEDLALVGSDTTNDNSSVWELNDDYVLMADLDFNVDASYRYTGTDKTIYTAGSGFTPIGNDPNFFTGSFDGNNNTIANLYINRSGSDNIGLFGFADGATLKDIGLTGVNVTGTEVVGGLVGCVWHGGSITNSYTTGDVSGDDGVGGLVGYAYNSAITNSYAIGAVSGTDFVGGLVGNCSRSTITDCYATGTVAGTGRVGGLVGYAYYSSSITACYATGTVAGTDFVGGLVGHANNNNSITNSIAFNFDISGSSEVNRVFGYNYDNAALTGNYANEAMTVTVGASTTTPGSADANGLNGANMTAAQFKTSSSAPYSSGWDFTNTWEFKPGADRPTLRGVGDDGGSMA